MLHVALVDVGQQPLEGQGGYPEMERDHRRLAPKTLRTALQTPIFDPKSLTTARTTQH